MKAIFAKAKAKGRGKGGWCKYVTNEMYRFFNNSPVGNFDGLGEDLMEGAGVDFELGAGVGLIVGFGVGEGVGDTLGLAEGRAVGFGVGFTVGFTVGAYVLVGVVVGAGVGVVVGARDERTKRGLLCNNAIIKRHTQLLLLLLLLLLHIEINNTQLPQLNVVYYLYTPQHQWPLRKAQQATRSKTDFSSS